MSQPSYLEAVEIWNFTRKLAEDQEEYNSLCIRDETLDDGSNAMVSEWKLTPEQIATLASGGSVFLCILGEEHPPVLMAVADRSS